MENNRPITCELTGRLGNNFFQIAHLIAYANMYGLKYAIPYLSPDCENRMNPFVNIVDSEAIRMLYYNNQPANYTYYKEPEKDFKSPFGGLNPYFHHVEYIPDVCFRGYYQSFKYFDWCRQHILDTFKIPYEKNDDMVSIHVRRGDYLSLSDAFPIVGMDYYKKAIKYFCDMGYASFVIFSDDLPFCKEYFKRTDPDFEPCSFWFSDNDSPISDLAKMSSCEHNIICNSSFSIIAGWLNQNKDKIVICPGRQHLFKSCNMDIIPDYFTSIDNAVAPVKNVIQLPQITLFAVATKDNDVEKTVKALIYSCIGIEYGAVKLISHYRPDNMPSYIQYEYVDKMSSIDDWNKYMVFDAWRHIDTDFGLLVHSDGFVVNPASFKPEFLDYDYIGAPWTETVADAIIRSSPQMVPIRVGNSVSIRSRKLMMLPTQVGMPWVRHNGDYNEDTQICVHNRQLFIDHGMKFADIEIAKYFSHEQPMPEIEGINPFAFHRYDGNNSKYPRFL